MDATAVGPALALAGLLAVGVVAGFFYGWQVSAMRGLRVVPDRTYVTTMQSVNRAILNPYFLLPFVGAVLLLSAATVVAFAGGHLARGWWLLAASVSYGVGTFGVTVAGNVPLNDALARFDLAAAEDEEVSKRRDAYEGPWNRLHRLRTVANLVAFTCAAVALLADPA